MIYYKEENGVRKQAFVHKSIRSYALDTEVEVINPNSRYYGRKGKIWAVPNYLGEYGVILDHEEGAEMRTYMVTIDEQDLKAVELPTYSRVMVCNKDDDPKNLWAWQLMVYMGGKYCSAGIVDEKELPAYMPLERFDYVVGVNDFVYEYPEVNCQRSL